MGCVCVCVCEARAEKAATAASTIIKMCQIGLSLPAPTQTTRKVTKCASTSKHTTKMATRGTKKGTRAVNKAITGKTKSNERNDAVPWRTPGLI